MSPDTSNYFIFSSIAMCNFFRLDFSLNLLKQHLKITALQSVNFAAYWVFIYAMFKVAIVKQGFVVSSTV